jgi:hypothetical protein
MADNAIEGIMVGYSSNHKAYKIFSQGKIVVSRNVHFDETVFPGRKLAVNKFYDPHTISGVSGGAGSAPNVIAPEYSLDQGEEMDTEEDQSVVTSDMEHVFSDMEHVSFDMELVPCEPRMSHSGSSQLHGNPSSDLEPMQPEASQDMGYLPDYEPLLPSPA